MKRIGNRHDKSIFIGALVVSKTLVMFTVMCSNYTNSPDTFNLNAEAEVSVSIEDTLR